MHDSFFNLACGESNRLIHQAQGIAHTALRSPRDQCDSARLEYDLLLLQHILQVARNQCGRQLFQVELQTTRQHGDRNFLRVGGGKDEFHMRGRFFQRLQHRVESALRQHVHLIDDVYLEAPAGRRVQRAFQQFAHVVHLGVRGGIQFDQIDKTTAIDLLACATFATRCGGDTGRAIQRLGKDTRNGGFAHPACAGEQISMMQPVLGERVAQRPDDMLLPRQLREGFRTPFAREDRCG